MRNLFIIISFLILLTGVAAQECTDSDGGGEQASDDALKNAGFVKYGITPMNDTCLTAEEGVSTASGRWLKEYYCTGSPARRTSKAYDCIKLGFEKCEDGRCKGAQTAAQQQTQVNPQTTCGNERLEKDKGENCDPPGGLCFGKSTKEYGICGNDCKCKISAAAEKSPPVCGDGDREEGEDCEADNDCPNSFVCSSCKCVKQLTPEEIEAMKQAAKPNKTAAQEVDEKYKISTEVPEVNLTATNFAEEPALKATSGIANFFRKIFSWIAAVFS